MVDGAHFGDHLCVVALGIGIDGTKHPLAVVEGATENTTTVTDLLVGLRDRGLDVTRPILVVIDGAKALRSAVETVFDCPVVARCQLHKIRNVQRARGRGDPGRARPPTRPVPPRRGGLPARGARRDPHRDPPRGAATLARTLRSTNAIEPMIEICRDHSTNVKHWRDGTMALRWCAAGMNEAAKQFRRVNGHLHLPALRAALEAEAARRRRGETVTPPNYDQNVA